MRAPRIVASVLLPILLADLSLVLTAFFYGWIASQKLGPLEILWGPLTLLAVFIQVLGLPFFMGIITAYFWYDDPWYAGPSQENLGCGTLGLWILPTLFFSCGATLLLIPLLLIPYWKGVDFGLDFWPRRRWREWLSLDVPEVEQRRKRK